jgi:hypothetical protein
MWRRQLHTIGDIGHQRIEDKSPSQRVRQSFTQLVPLEVLVTDTLLIDTDAFNGKDAIFFAQPSSVKLVVGYREEENYTNRSGQQPSKKENDLPTSNGSWVGFRAFSDAIRNDATEDLREAVKREPDACSRSLLFFRVPLAGKECEARRYSGFEYSEEESDGDGACEVGDCGEACQCYAPCDHAEGRVLGQR